MAELESGKVIAGKYRLLQPISEGGMGAIWRAQHTQLEAPVAIKVVHASLLDKEGTLARFEREAGRQRGYPDLQVSGHGLHQRHRNLALLWVFNTLCRCRFRRGLEPGGAVSGGRGRRILDLKIQNHPAPTGPAQAAALSGCPELPLARFIRRRRRCRLVRLAEGEAEDVAAGH